MTTVLRYVPLKTCRSQHLLSYTYLVPSYWCRILLRMSSLELICNVTGISLPAIMTGMAMHLPRSLTQTAQEDGKLIQRPTTVHYQAFLLNYHNSMNNIILKLSPCLPPLSSLLSLLPHLSSPSTLLTLISPLPPLSSPSSPLSLLSSLPPLLSPLHPQLYMCCVKELTERMSRWGSLVIM